MARSYYIELVLNLENLACCQVGGSKIWLYRNVGVFHLQLDVAGQSVH